MSRLNKKLILISGIVIAVGVLYPVLKKTVIHVSAMIKAPGEIIELKKDNNYTKRYLNIINDVIRANMQKVDTLEYIIDDSISVVLRKSTCGNIYVYYEVNGRKLVYAAPYDNDEDARYFITSDNQKKLIEKIKN